MGQSLVLHQMFQRGYNSWGDTTFRDHVSVRTANHNTGMLHP